MKLKYFKSGHKEVSVDDSLNGTIIGNRTNLIYPGSNVRVWKNTLYKMTVDSPGMLHSDIITYIDGEMKEIGFSRVGKRDFMQVK